MRPFARRKRSSSGCSPRRLPPLQPQATLGTVSASRRNPMSEPKLHDSALRAMTDDGAFRVVIVRATDTVTRLIEAQKVHGRNAKHLGELTIAAVLVRETMAPTHRLQILLRSGDGQGRFVADSHPDGGSRGLLAAADKQQDVSVDSGTLEVVRTLFTGDLHRGVVEVPASGGISAALMAYLQDSEQVASMLAISCVMQGERVVAAGGYLVQLLPEVGRAPLAIMAERLSDFRDIGPLLVRNDAAPAPLLDELLYGMPFTRLEESPLSWKCRCTAVRVMSSLATLSRADIADLVKAGEPIELSCDFCGQAYSVSPAQLRGLLEES
jgi:molecular chaperone Hsp33